IHTKNAGPFSTTTDLGIITVTSTAALVTISGTVVNCNAAAVTNGYVTINLEEIYYRSNLVNGVFSIPVTRCSNTAASAIIVPYDIAGAQSGAAGTVAISGSSVNAGQFVACGNELKQYINFTINGNAYSYTGVDSIIGYRSISSQQTLVSGFRINS